MNTQTKQTFYEQAPMAPLSDVRVIAVEQYGAGPYGSMVLADLGAEVIKIEDPRGGEIARHVPPYIGKDDSIYFQALNRRKKSVCLDTRTPAGQLVFRKLVSAADAVYNNLRGDQPAFSYLRRRCSTRIFALVDIRCPPHRQRHSQPEARVVTDAGRTTHGRPAAMMPRNW